MQTFNFKVNMGPTTNASFNTIKVQYVDGYTTHIKHGINNKRQDWSGQKTGDLQTVIKPIMDFIDEHEGVKPFLWRNPYGEIKKYICDGYNVKQNVGNSWVISLEFTQVF